MLTAYWFITKKMKIVHNKVAFQLLQTRVNTRDLSTPKDFSAFNHLIVFYPPTYVG